MAAILHHGELNHI